MNTPSRKVASILLKGAAEAYGSPLPEPTCALCGGSPAEERAECDEPDCPSLKESGVSSK